MLVVVDELQQALHSLFLGDILLHALLTFIKGDLAPTCTHIAVVGIGHLARTIHDAAHDADLQAYQMAGSRLDTSNGLLQIVERTATPRAGDIFGLGKLDAGSLEDGVC